MVVLSALEKMSALFGTWIRQTCFLFALVFTVLPASALVEPEVEGWDQLTRQLEQSLPGPAGQFLGSAASGLGALGGELAAAPLRELMTELETRRGLKFKYFTPWHSKDKQAFRSYIRRELERHYTPTKIDQEESLLKVLGLVPMDFKVIPFTEELLTDAVAGVYDTATDQFFLVDMQGGLGLSEGLKAKAVESITGDTSTVVIIHELDHALGGQHFPLIRDLDSLVKSASLDELMAVQALIEGDASFIMFDHQRKLPPHEQGAQLELRGLDFAADLMTKFPFPLPGMGKFSQAPLFFQKSLLFPYYIGAEFVAEVRHSEWDWSAVNKAYSEPPKSTAQIYHPSSFIFLPHVAKNPDFSRLPVSLGDWEKVVDETGGEFLVRVVLEQYGVKDYRSAAEGWLGDRIRVYRNTETGALGFYWAIRWISKHEADEFYQSLGSRLPFVVEREATVVFLSLAFDGDHLRTLRSSLGSSR